MAVPNDSGKTIDVENSTLCHPRESGDPSIGLEEFELSGEDVCEHRASLSASRRWRNGFPLLRELFVLAVVYFDCLATPDGRWAIERELGFSPVVIVIPTCLCPCA